MLELITSIKRAARATRSCLGDDLCQFRFMGFSIDTLSISHELLQTLIDCQEKNPRSCGMSQTFA